MTRVALAFVALAGLAACGADHKYASDADVARARFVAEAPTSVTLYTVINNNTQAGAHSSLLINGSERVIFDPAGTWYSQSVPERNDLHYGMSDRMLDFYLDYHARITYRVVEQTILVSPETAALVLARAEAHGSVPKAGCAQSIGTILRGVPGFEDIRVSFFPKQLSKSFGELPGVTERVIYDEDADNNHGVLMLNAQGVAEDF
jgi:hypothetical protein